MPSVRGVGGSLVYFIADGSGESLWSLEFPTRLDNARAGKSLGLLRTDHIAQTMQYEEFLSWLLYYVALFNVEKTPIRHFALR